jgi:mannose-6-phosphate isomerase-like protein (cupin superfamily)
MTPAEDLAARIRRQLQALQEPALGAFLADWPRRAAPRAVAASSLPVLRWLSRIAADAAAYAPALVAALCSAADSLQWRQTYAAEDVGEAFLDNYGWCEVLGSSGPLMSERIACGFLLLGPDTLYPRHRHEAEEIYLPLSGTAIWQRGDAEWREQRPGTAIHHTADQTHAMRTQDSALLALYIWRGAGVAKQARLERVRA